MAECFEDWRWAALNDPIRMKDYWDGMRRADIDDVEAKNFLQVVWMICAATGDMNFLRSARQAEEKEAAAYETLKKYQSNIAPPSPDESVMSATNSRKKNNGLDCGRYLVAEAEKRFGRPLYAAISQAVSVALDLNEDMTPEALKQACHELKKR